MIRPEWIIPTPAAEGEATVIDREYYGHDQMLLIELPDGRRVQARIGPRPVLDRGDTVDLALPVWRPGRYLVFDPAGTVRGLTATGGDGIALPVEKVGKSTA